MKELARYLLKSEVYQYLPVTMKRKTEKVFESLFSTDLIQDFCGGFYPSYFSTLFSLDDITTLTILNVGYQSGLLELLYLVENPITGETIKTLNPSQFTEENILNIEEDLLDENGEPLCAKITSNDIYPFYVITKGVA